MTYCNILAARVRSSLSHLQDVEEVEKMGGLTFLYNEKVCIRIQGNELMCRVDPATYDAALQKTGSHEWIYNGKPMMGWVMVKEYGYQNKKDFEYWVNLCLVYNGKAKSTKRTAR